MAGQCVNDLWEVVLWQEHSGLVPGRLLPGFVVSLDAINAERRNGGQGIPTSEWARTNELAREQVLTRLGDDETVIVEDTSSPRFLRDGWRMLCSSVSAPMVLVFVDTPDEVTRLRLLDNRTAGLPRDVTDEVMARHEEGFEPPEKDEQAVRLQMNSSLSTSTVSARSYEGA